MKEFLKLSRLFCICLASITSASAGAADWRLAEVGDSAAMYVDVESIRRDASKVWFWAQTLMIPEVFEQNPRESRHLYAADCRMMEYKVIAGKVYNQQTELWDNNKLAPLFPKDFALPGTLIYVAIDNSCKRRGWSTGAVNPMQDARARLLQAKRSTLKR